MRILLTLSVFLFVLVGCQTDESHLTEKEVVKALQENGIELIKTKNPKSIYSSKLAHVKPATYELNGKSLVIYQFDTEIDRDKGKAEFVKKTESMNLTSASSFEINNLLIYYVHDQELHSDNVPFEKEIQEIINEIKK